MHRMKATERFAANKAGNGRLMSIREVSALTGVPPHTLRFWEKQMPDVLNPERTPGGQRRYSREMAERVRAIKRLSDERQYSLAAIRDKIGGGEIADAPRNVGPRIRAEQTVDLIVEEVASMLKRRLLDLFEADETGKSDGPDRNPKKSPPHTPEGGNRLGLQRQPE